MNDQKLSFISRFIGSISNFKIYAHFNSESVGKAVKYLLLITLLLGTISLLKPIYTFHSISSTFVDSFKSEVPDFVLHNGELNVSENKPFVFKQDGFILMIDTSNQTDESLLEPYDNGLLVLKNKVIEKQGLKTQIINLRDLKGLEFSKADILGWLPLLNLIYIFIVIFGIISFFVSKLLSALIIGIIGLLLNKIAQTNLHFDNLFKLGIYSLTTSIILQVLIGFTPVTVPGFWILYYGLAIFYLWKCLSNIKYENSLTLVPEETLTLGKSPYDIQDENANQRQE